MDIDTEILDLELLLEEDLLNHTVDQISEHIRLDSNNVDETVNEPDENRNEENTISTSHSTIENSIWSEPIPEKFNKLVDKCACEPKCDTGSFKKLAISFQKLTETERRNIVMGMLIPLTSMKGETNKLSLSNIEYIRSRKKKRKTESVSSTQSRLSSVCF